MYEGVGPGFGCQVSFRDRMFMEKRHGFKVAWILGVAASMGSYLRGVSGNELNLHRRFSGRFHPI